MQNDIKAQLKVLGTLEAENVELKKVKQIEEDHKKELTMEGEYEDKIEILDKEFVAAKEE